MNPTQIFLVLKARKKIIFLTLLCTVLTTTIVSLVVPKTYTATASIVVNVQYIDPVTGVQMEGLLLPSYMSTQADIIASHSTALQVVKKLGFAKDPQAKEDFEDATHGQGDINDWLADLTLKDLKVTPSRESNVIDISFPSPDPRSAAVITNAFVNAYIQTNLDLKTQPAKKTADWYNSRLKELRTNLEKAQIRLAEYQKTHGIIIGGQVDTESARLEAISAQLVTAQAQSFDSVSRSRNSGKDLADVMNNQTVQSTNISLVQSEAKLSQLASTEGANNPEYQSALAEVNSLRQKLANEIQSVRQSVATSAGIAQQSVAALRAAVATQEQRVLALKMQQDQGAVLLGDVNDAQKLYDTASQSFGQNELQSKTNHTDISILNPAAVPNKKSSPKVLLNIVVSTFLGGLLGLGFGMVMEMRDRRIRSMHDLMSELNIPVLGVIVSNQVIDVRGRGFKRLAIQ